MASDAVTLEIPGPHGVREQRVSSPSRVLWPEAGVTKLQYAEYLVEVAEPFLRANGDRPVSLQRFSGDVTGEQFFSKNPPRGVPDYVRSVEVTYPSGRTHPQLVLDEAAALVWAAQMNTVVFHPWPCVTADVDQPDQVRLDLDPQPGRPFADVVTVALAAKDLLEEIGLAPFVKTSGNRGLHVTVAVVPEHEFLVVRHAVIAIARELERRLPDLVTTSWWKEERGDRVFIDFNQAARDRTMAGAYSARPLPLATVSTPLEWSEVREVVPREHTVLTVPDRLRDIGDPWASLGEHPGSLATALEWWERDVSNGLGELPFPPDYPKMPGEPPRVQPSRAKSAPE